MSVPFVSVCVPVYNGAAFLADCLESIRSQSFRDFEVVIVDDQSTDETLQVAEMFVKQDARFRTIRNSHRLGLVGNWNRTIELSAAPWIKLLFQDDIMHPDCLASFLAVCDQNERPFIFCHRRVLLDENASESTREYYGEHGLLLERLHSNKRYMAPDAFAEACVDNPGTNLVGEPSVTMFHRSLVDRFGLFNPALVQIPDTEYWCRLGTNIGVVYLSEELATFRVHSSSATSHNVSRRLYRMSVLDPLVVDYLFLSGLFYNRLRKRLFRSLPRQVRWRRLMRDAYKAWQLARQSSGSRNDRETTLENEWRGVTAFYPALRYLAVAGSVICGIKGIFDNATLLGWARYLRRGA